MSKKVSPGKNAFFVVPVSWRRRVQGCVDVRAEILRTDVLRKNLFKKYTVISW